MTRLVLALAIVVAVLTIASPSYAGKTQGYGKENTKEIQNLLISNYIIDFEQIRRQCSDVRVQEAMTDMKLLMTQRWIIAFSPDIHLLRDIIPQSGLRTVNEVNKDIVRDLEDRNDRSPVADSMKLYTEKKEGEIQEYFDEQVSTMTTERDQLFNDLHDKDKQSDREYIDAQYKDKSGKLRQANFNKQFHSLAKTMAMQSYNLIFDKSK